MTKELFHKFLNNRCTSGELKEVIDWINRQTKEVAADDSLLAEWMKTDINLSEADPERLSYLLDKIHHKLNLETQQAEIRPRETKVSFLTWMTRVAAILLLPVMAFLVYTLSKNNYNLGQMAGLQVDTMEIVSPAGSRTNFVLPDGSKVFLNNGSTLRYPMRFTHKEREVVLSGEAYFEVAHNERLPFVVKTKNLNVTALGTEFNVFAYPSEDIVEATLVKGKVLVDRVLKNGETRRFGEMVPSQHISYNTKKGNFTSSHGNIEKYISWRDGKLVFKNDNIDQIMTRLGRWYNVDIELADPRVRELTYTATFVDETLPQILDLLKLATPITYTIIPRRENADGSFSRQKVIIGYKKSKI